MRSGVGVEQVEPKASMPSVARRIGQLHEVVGVVALHGVRDDQLGQVAPFAAERSTASLPDCVRLPAGTCAYGVRPSATLISSASPNLPPRVKSFLGANAGLA